MSVQPIDCHLSRIYKCSFRSFKRTFWADSLCLILRHCALLYYLIRQIQSLASCLHFLWENRVCGLPVHIEDIELSYQSLVYAAVLQRMNGIISRFFLAFTCRKKKEKKKKFFSFLLSLCSRLQSTPPYCMYVCRCEVFKPMKCSDF